MPYESEAQRRAMEAAAHGHSTLGISKKVGKDYVAAGPAKSKLPNYVHRRKMAKVAKSSHA
jgi:hypothetical protein